MIEYKGTCQRCNQGFSFYRSQKMTPAMEYPQYCPECRKLKYQGNHNGYHHTEPRYIDSNGYVYLRIGNKYVCEHRYIMGQFLGRELQHGEVVHHKDCNRSNNLLSNLELWTSPHLAGIRLSDLICPHCGKSYAPS